MSTQRQRTLHGNPPAPQAFNKYPSRRFSVHHEIQKLQEKLAAFNERIAELEDEDHRGHAMDVLKANAIDFARQIDELRCLLVESAPKHAPEGKVKRLSKS